MKKKSKKSNILLGQDSINMSPNGKNRSTKDLNLNGKMLLKTRLLIPLLFLLMKMYLDMKKTKEEN